MLFKPFPFQDRVNAKLHRHGGRALLCAAPGLGKTPMAIRYAVETDSFPIAVACPSSVKLGWERECRKHFGIKAEVLEGTKPYELPERKVYSVNYDILHAWVPTLKAIPFKLTVGDEAHLVKSRRARRSKAFREMTRGIDKMLLLTGTPVLNRPAELWNLLNLLWPDMFPSYFSFCLRYAGAKRKFFGWDFSGASNLEELHDILKECGTVRVSRRIVERELPKKQLLMLPMPLSNPKEYAEAKQDFLTWLKKISPQKAKRAAKAETLCRISYMKRLAARLKMPSVFEWIDSFLEEDDGKLVVFAIHRKAVEALAERYGHSCVVVDGSTPSERRREMVDRFRSNPSIRVFVGNVQAAGVGLDGLQRASCVGLMAEMPWTPGEVQQAMGRLARIGQEHPVRFFFAVAKGTVEEHLCELLQKKSRVIDAVMEGKEAGDLDIYNELLKKI